MKVEFAVGVMNDERAFRHLTAIFWTFVDGRHHWVVPDLDAVGKSAWCQQEGPRTRAAILQLAEKFGRRTHQTASLEICAGGGAERTPFSAPPREAELYLCAPLIVLVENARCDGAFIRLIFQRIARKRCERIFGCSTWEQLLNDWRTELGDGRWLAVRHGGGNTTATQLELLAQASGRLPPRAVVVLDSDRSAKDGKLGATASAVQAKCQKNSRWRVTPFVLARREVENYIPEGALKQRYGQKAEWTTYQETFDKDYGDLKKLFGDDVWRILLNEDLNTHFHVRALRERAGQNGEELDKLVSHILDAL